MVIMLEMNFGVCSERNRVRESEEVSALNVPISPYFQTFQNGDYVADGVSLRANNSGTITITLPPSSTITNAFLYWEAMEDNDTLSDTGSFNGNPIRGTLIATSGDLCWGREVTHYFRTDVTDIVSEGNNSVQINLGGPETLLEGASLVVIFSNPNFPTKNIMINDGGVALIGTSASTTFSGFFAQGVPLEARTTYIVGDGQEASDSAFFNGNLVAGPDAFVGGDGPFWDTLTLDVSNLVSSGDTSATAEIRASSDCLGWIAQVFSVTQICPPCDNTVDFSAEILVPQPFDVLEDNTGAALDVSCLQCCLDSCEVTADVPDPCGGTISCPVDIAYVSAVGCVNVYVNVTGQNPDNSQTIAFCGRTTVCVDNVICYQCFTEDNPCEPGFFNETRVEITSTTTTETSGGNTLVTVRGTITLPEC
jgi:hypothetical protein